MSGHPEWSGYRPGAAYALVGAGGAVIADGDRLGALMALAEAGLTAALVVREIARGDLSELGSFAAVLADGTDLVVIVRGSCSVRVREETVEGSGAATWIERRIVGAAGHAVDLSANAEPTGGPLLPLVAGVVPADRVLWRTSGPAAEDGAGFGVFDGSSVTSTASSAPSAPAGGVVRASTKDVDEVDAARVDESEQGAGLIHVPSDEREDEQVTTPVDLATAEPTELLPLTPGRLDDPSRTLVPPDPGSVGGAQNDRRSRGFTLVAPDGRVNVVRSAVVVGRSPVAGAGDTRVVVADPHVSATHVRVEDGPAGIRVIDLSTNGTIVDRLDGTRQVLEAGVSVEISIGSTLWLSDDLALRVES